MQLTWLETKCAWFGLTKPLIGLASPKMLGAHICKQLALSYTAAEE